METTYENILPIVNSFSDIEKPFTTTIYKNWHTIASDTTPTIWPSKPLSTYTKPSHSQLSCLLHTNTWLTTTQFLTQLLTYTYIHPHIETHSIVGTHPPPSFCRGGGWASNRIFKKGEGAWQDLNFYRRVARKEGVAFSWGRGGGAILT